MPTIDLLAQGEHVMTVCNACRYCEGYCPVFPAMEERLTFMQGDLTYLANLCHNCGECLFACQYAPPHEFGINVPKLLAQVRVHSYETYCWPRPLGAAFRHHGVLTAFATTFVLTAVIALYTMIFGASRLWESRAGGDFYAVIPHDAMVGSFGAVSLFVVIALLVGVTRFWRDIGPSGPVRASAILSAMRDAVTLKHLHGDGTDCATAEETRSPARRVFHHVTVLGFTLCFASTSVAAVYHSLLGWSAPYAYTSLPVVLGAAGGIGLLIGPIGLLMLRRRRDPELMDRDQRGLDVSFIALLVVASLTGLALLVWRNAPAMGVLLLVHLGCVLTLFVTLPYGKFVHGLYRTAALIKYALDNAATAEESEAAVRRRSSPPYGHPSGSPDLLPQARSLNVTVQIHRSR